MSKIIDIGPLQSLRQDQIERVKMDESLGTYPTARLIMAAFMRLEHAGQLAAKERKAEVERAARQRF